MRLLSIVITALYVMASASSAFAHAHLVGSSPAAGVTVKVAPTELTLRFTEALEGAFCTVDIVDEAGARADAGKATLDAQDARVLHVTLAPLAKRKYKVIWKAVSVDSHTTHGDFTFTVAP
jgi:methionine-rich copper-binding protein CopC